MILISTTHRPATDLGYLLHKNPARSFMTDASFGKVFVVYPEATEERCTAALVVEVDMVGIVKGRKWDHGSLSQYVNDRAYVANSFLSVALAEAFSTAMNGRCKDRPELVETGLPLEIRVPIFPCRTQLDRIPRLFGPLGYEVTATRLPLDPEFPEWGESPYVDLTLKGTVRLQDALRHLYLLLPALDAQKHYFMDDNEVGKILSKGEGWLAAHPERNWIVRAYLGRRPSLVRSAMEQLANVEATLETESRQVDESLIEGPATEAATEETPPSAVESSPRPRSLHARRHARVMEIVRELKPSSVVDLGCGEGQLLRQLVKTPGIDRIVGMDVSYYSLERAHRNLHIDEAGPRKAERIQLIHGSLMYRDQRIAGFDVCTVIEVVEHLDLPRLAAFERVVFEYARPKTVILSTPNRDYNAVYEIDGLRHSDHRFEWSTEQFRTWCEGICERFGFSLTLEGVGDSHEVYGHPSNLAVFRS